jgi:hypothetical protein
MGDTAHVASVQPTFYEYTSLHSLLPFIQLNVTVFDAQHYLV